MSELAIAAFGAVDGSLWATAAVHGSATALAIGGGEAQTAVADGVRWSGEAIEGDGVSLALTPVAPVSGDGPGVTGSGAEGQRLCRVTGTVAVGGAEREIDCPGVIATVAHDAHDARHVARLVAGWLGEAEALCLTAVRPADRAAHDGDALAASLFEPTGWMAVSDPRLSTTYDGDGLPTRCTLELWVGTGEEEFPRRAAGEASGAPASVAAPGAADRLALQVSPLHFHSRGEEGTGVYVLASL